MPRNNQLSLSAPRSPTMGNNGMSSTFNAYTGQLAVSVQDNGNGQWTEGACPSKAFILSYSKNSLLKKNLMHARQKNNISLV